MGRGYYTHFPDEDIDGQKGGNNCPESNSLEVAEQGRKIGSTQLQTFGTFHYTILAHLEERIKGLLW